MDILKEIEKLEKEIKKAKPIKSYSKDIHKNEVNFWYNQSHEMQINCSIILGYVVPFKDKLKVEIRKLKSEKQNLKNKIENLEKNNKTINQNTENLKTEIENLKLENQNLKLENQNLKNKIGNLEKNNKTNRQNWKISSEKNKRLTGENKNLKTEIENLEMIIKTLEKKQLVPFKNRGGCKLTDEQIKRLLMVYAKRGKYANMSFNKAISTISQTRNTYYKVIKQDYRSEATRERIRAIALENGIELPNRFKIS